MANTHPGRVGHRLHPTQVHQTWDMGITLAGLTVNTPGTLDVTAALGTAIPTAGRNSANNLPVQPAADTDTQGVVTNSILLVLDSASSDTIVDANGHNVYAKITEAAGTYTVTLYSRDDAGVENPYDPGAAITVDVCVQYRALWENLPPDFAYRQLSKKVFDDPALSATDVHEIVPVTAVNTLAALSQVPLPGTNACYYVNGKEEDELAGGSITRAGAGLTWNQALAGYDLETTFRVVAVYKV